MVSAVSPAPRVPPGADGILLTATEVATFLSIRVTTLHKWCEQGHVPYGRIGRDYRFDREQIQSWLDAQWHDPSTIPDQRHHQNKHQPDPQPGRQRQDEQQETRQG